MFVDIIKMFIL